MRHTTPWVTWLAIVCLSVWTGCTPQKPQYRIGFSQCLDDDWRQKMNFEMERELLLTEELRNRLANAGHWMIQFNKEDGDPFNVTDIVLVMAEEEGFENTAVESKAAKSFRNGQLVIEKNGKFYNALGAELK